MSLLRPTAVALAAASGIILLLDRFVSWPLLARLATILVDWAVLLAAIALLAGLTNLARQHGRVLLRPAASGEETASPASLGSRLASLALLAMLLLTLAAGLTGPPGEAGPLAAWLFHFVQAPLQAALFSLLAFYLLSAAYRALRPGGILGRTGSLFILAAALTLWAQLPGQRSGWLLAVRDWLEQAPTLAAVRGLLLGVALGAALTGLRVLLGLSRPYAADGEAPDGAALARLLDRPGPDQPGDANDGGAGP